MIVYGEPDENGDYVEIRLTEQDAINRQRACPICTAARSHIQNDYTDEKALADFITIHWAWTE